ncbi:aminotransferase class IV [Mangrovibacterium lignilyticum]|uniref:aminotransferase class IV n=1 Tax=Mangrovibacterium lignilyticum TaxID=2668052 RepID=UPI0013D71A8F|nr:aminotransferase class IV [Mangrovibacterium lignilyticum]
MIGFNNGSYEEIDKIAVPITSLSVNRGYGAFEFFEIINHRPFYGERHLVRFRRSMELLKLYTDFDNDLQEIVNQLIQRNKIEHSYIKAFALPHDIAFEGTKKASLYVFPIDMPMYDPKLYTNGAQLILKKHRRFMPEAKSTNYLASQYWMDQEENKQVVDVLLHDGINIQETSRGNIFLVKDNTVLTPAEGVLKGVTRGLVIELLAEKGLLHAETDVSLSMLFSADEVFVSSTTKHIMPIIQIDDVVIGDGKPGPVTCKIREAFLRLRHDY